MTKSARDQLAVLLIGESFGQESKNYQELERIVRYIVAMHRENLQSKIGYTVRRLSMRPMLPKQEARELKLPLSRIFSDKGA